MSEPSIRAHGAASKRSFCGRQTGIAREVLRYLTTTVTTPEIADLRPARQTKNITLAAGLSTALVGDTASAPVTARSRVHSFDIRIYVSS